MKNRFLTKQFQVLIFLTLISASTLRAQNWHADINLIAGFPQNEFKSNIEAKGFGIGGAIGYQLGNRPIMFGGEFSFMVYGSETRSIPFRADIPAAAYNVETSNNIFVGHLFVRLQNNHGAFRPYVEGLFGMNGLYTETQVRDAVSPNEIYAKSVNQKDNALSYGAGGGLMFRVHKSEDDDGDSVKEIFINTRLRYLLGQEATYLKKGAANELGEVFLEPGNSRTDLITFQLGVALTF